MRVSKPLLLLSAGVILLISATFTAAIQLETRDAFCASCHTEPESEYYSRTLVQPSDLASYHAQSEGNFRCIDCHTEEGISGRVGSLSQGASDLFAYLTRNYQQPTTTQHPIGDQACLKCHMPLDSMNPKPEIIEIASNSHYPLESYLNEWKARTANPVGTCSLCHISHSDYYKGDDDYGEILTMNIACDQCHRTLSGWIPPK